MPTPDSTPSPETRLCVTARPLAPGLRCGAYRQQLDLGHWGQELFSVFFITRTTGGGTQILSPIGSCFLLALPLLSHGALGKSPNPGDLCFLISKSDGTVVPTVTLLSPYCHGGEDSAC